MYLKNLCLLLVIVLFTVSLQQQTHSPSTNRNPSRPDSNDRRPDRPNNPQERRKCIVKGQYNQLCVDIKDSNKKFRKTKYKPEYKCYSKAKCGFSNGKCRWLQTVSYKKCIKSIQNNATHNHH